MTFSPPKKLAPRTVALKYLCEVLSSKQHLSQLLQSNDPPFVKELCFGVCRYYFMIEAFLADYVKKKPKHLEVWVSLLMGCYQLYFMKQPDYAVLQETVALLNTKKLSYAKGFVNGVLRQIHREKQTGKLLPLKAAQYATQEWFKLALMSDWPDDWQAILLAQISHPPMILRVNCQVSTPEAYLKLLQEQGLQALLHEALPGAIILETPVPVDKLPGFFDGLVSVQDVSAQLAASLLDVAPGMCVLDACAAPGGKTGHILEIEPHLKRCLAVDVDAKRVKRIRDNLARLKLSAEVACVDATALVIPQNERFDRILLDAPCSATGVIRRHPDIQLLRTEREVVAIQQAQRALLFALWRVLKPGGKLLYVTCSVLRKENDDQLEGFLAHHPDAQVVSLSLPFGRKTRYGWQTLPGEAKGDGFYYAFLEKQL